MKKFLACLFLGLASQMCFAQEVFWGFDESNKELIVPPECDSIKDANELYEVGMRLYDETGYAKQGASYCLLAAAMQNHAQAQYQVAYMYHKGILLPQSDLAAYKWATLSALNGSVEGDKLGASIEQFLSVNDIKTSTESVTDLLPIISKKTQKTLEEQQNRQALLKQEIKAVLAEIRDLKKYGYVLHKTLDANKASKEKLMAELAGFIDLDDRDDDYEEHDTDNESGTNTKKMPKIQKQTTSFTKEDLKDVPMPVAK